MMQARVIANVPRWKAAAPVFQTRRPACIIRPRMSLRIYNTLTRQKDLFEPVIPGKVSMYLCGPTVYKPPHIGHMVGPVIFDAIKRYLSFKGFAVTWVVNITDVDDKLIDTAKKQNTTVKELAEKYTGEYFDALARLGVDQIDHFPRASDYMAEIIDMCQALIARGHAYEAHGSVYFDVASDADYGKLSRRKTDDQETGTREVVGAQTKRNPGDFALWKAAKEGEIAWESPWGHGRPGWHIECSAMSRKLLGDSFDIHGGGMDLLFPHHENEIAQSESCTGKPQARFWLHNGLTRIKTKLASGEWASEKMSGSIGNVVSAADLLEQYGADVIRYLLLSTHYRSPIEFDDDALTAARKGLQSLERLRDRANRLARKAADASGRTLDAAAAELLASDDTALAKDVIDLRMKFMEAMDDDLNTAVAIATLHEIASRVNGYIEQTSAEKAATPQRQEAIWICAAEMIRLGRILGLFTVAAPAKSAADELTPKLMDLLIQLRAEARQTKNFALADSIRKGLDALGVVLEDRAGSTGWSRKA
jgi:cysteinyl-tRNA synthetase